MAQENLLGFKAAVYEFTALSRFGGFRWQEFAMDSTTKIKYYVLPDGTKVIRAFTLKNLIFYDVDECRIARPLMQRDVMAKLGKKYDVQTNRTNGQIINFARAVENCSIFGPVELGLNIVTSAQILGMVTLSQKISFAVTKTKKAYST